MPEETVFDGSRMLRQREDGLDGLMMEPLICDGQQCVAGMNRAKDSGSPKEKGFE